MTFLKQLNDNNLINNHTNQLVMRKKNLDIVGRACVDEEYKPAYSTTVFNVYEAMICFEGYYHQLSYVIRPKSEEGVQLSVEYWFSDFARCHEFMQRYNRHHSLRFWLTRQSHLNTKFTIVYLKWLSKIMRRI